MLTDYLWMAILLMACGALFAGSGPAAAEPPVYSDRVTNPETEKYYVFDLPAASGYGRADFAYWQPAALDKLEGVVVCLPGGEGDGRHLAKDFRWQAFATNHHFGLLACFLQNTSREADNPFAKQGNYRRAADGSGQALLTALAHFAEETKHPEVAGAPLLFWGFSAGGTYSYSFACWKPERVIAFVMNKSGADDEPRPASLATRRVPGLLFVGEKDEDRRNGVLDAIFRLNRNLGAPWAIAVQPGVGHEEGDSRELALRFFDASVPLRLSGTGGPLQEIDQSVGWLGALQTRMIWPATTKSESNALSSWLPDQKTARYWQLHVSGKNEPVHLP